MESFSCRFLLRLTLLAPSRHLPKSLEAPAGHLWKPGASSRPFLKLLLQLSVGGRLHQNEEHQQSAAATWILLHQKNKLHRPLSSIKGGEAIIQRIIQKFRNSSLLQFFHSEVLFRHFSPAEALSIPISSPLHLHPLLQSHPSHLTIPLPSS